MLEFWRLQASWMLRTDLIGILIEVLGRSRMPAFSCPPIVIVLTEGNQLPGSCPEA